MNTTQGTAGLIEKLTNLIVRDAAESDTANPDNPDCICIDVNDLILIVRSRLEEESALSTKPAPVAEPVAHVIEERSTQYISAEDAMQSGLGYSAGSFPVVNLSIAMLPGKRTPPTGTTFYLRPPAPELAVADDDEEICDLLDKLEGAMACEDDDAVRAARKAIVRAYDAALQSRSPVQEGMVMVPKASLEDLKHGNSCWCRVMANGEHTMDCEVLQSALSTSTRGSENG